MDSDDDDEPEKEEEPEPEPDDIPGKIKYYLHLNHNIKKGI